MSSIGQPVPELPVVDVERAQQHYRDALGFEIGWLYPGKGIGAVSRGNAVIFFRKRTPPFEPAIHWVFAEDIDASYQELKSLGANIVDPRKKSPGDYGSSLYRTWTGTCSISTVTNQRRMTIGWSWRLKSAAAQPQAVLRLAGNNTLIQIRTLPNSAIC